MSERDRIFYINESIDYRGQELRLWAFDRALSTTSDVKKAIAEANSIVDYIKGGSVNAGPPKNGDYAHGDQG